MNKTRKYFYEDFENTEFFHRGFDIYRRTVEGEFKFFSVKPEDNPKEREAFICWVREHKQYAVILLTWSIKRNILVFDKEENKFLYQLHDPQNVFSSRPNCWINVFSEHDMEEKDCFMAKSVDKYIELIRYHDGKVMRSIGNTSNDPRDF